jgi:hypothetical protein
VKKKKENGREIRKDKNDTNRKILFNAAAILVCVQVKECTSLSHFDVKDMKESSDKGEKKKCFSC